MCSCVYKCESCDSLSDSIGYTTTSCCVSILLLMHRLLGPCLGCLLWQFPANFHATSTNMKRIRELLAYLPKDINHAFEFRHDRYTYPVINIS
jgi:Protein of unknown function DUF72